MKQHAQRIDEKLNFGILHIDKPSGPTSFSVSNFVCEKLGLKKTSHLGTLDPKVTGVLPITLGRACKLAGYFIGHDKGYVGILHTHTAQDMKTLQALIDTHFIGIITQTPPHKSAVKRAPRKRKVYEWTLLEASEENKEFLFYCEVEGGTYIRKLCSDIGEMIGGAHMAELRRTKAGIFTEEKLYTLPEFERALSEYKKGNAKALDDMITPATHALKKIMPCIEIQKNAVPFLLTGKPLFLEYIVDKKSFQKMPVDTTFAVFSKDTFIEVATKVEQKNDIIARPLFVYN